MNIKDITQKLTELQDELRNWVIAEDKDRRYDPKYKAQVEAGRKAFNKVNRAVQLLENHVLGTPRVKRQTELKRNNGGGPDCNKPVEETHESYGYIEANRVSGSTRLVGAMTNVLPNFIELRIRGARRIIHQGTNSEHYFAEGPMLVIVQMSVYQWAELITGMNMAGHVCTLRNIMGVDLDRVPEEVTTPMEQIVDNLKQEVSTTEVEEEFFKNLDALNAKIDAAGLSNKKADDIKKAVEALRSQVNAPKASAEWAAQCFAETSEKVLTQTRVEIAASLNSLVHQVGVKGLAEHLTTLHLPEKAGSDE